MGRAARRESAAYGISTTTPFSTNVFKAKVKFIFYSANSGGQADPRLLYRSEKQFGHGRDQRVFLLHFTGRCSAKSPHNRAGSVPQKSASVTSGISNAECSAGFRLRFRDGRFAPAPFPPSLHFSVRGTAGRSLRWIAGKLMLMQPSPMAEISRLPILRFCIFESFDNAGWH
jgi:hypothetical protein